jgi:hypothetical protein
LIPDVQYYLKEKARLLNNTCLERLLVAIPPPEGQQAPGMGQTGGPREYVHRSAGSGSGSGQQGSSSDQQMAAMSAASEDNQAA